MDKLEQAPQNGYSVLDMEIADNNIKVLNKMAVIMAVVEIAEEAYYYKITDKEIQKIIKKLPDYNYESWDLEIYKFLEQEVAKLAS